MAVDLNPCPFCGSTNIRTGFWSPTSFHIFCGGKDVPGRHEHSRECPSGGDCFQTEEAAINWWNTRTMPNMTITHVDSRVECERLREELAAARAEIAESRASIKCKQEVVE